MGIDQIGEKTQMENWVESAWLSEQRERERNRGTKPGGILWVLTKWVKKPKWGIGWKVLSSLKRERERETEELKQEKFYGQWIKWEKKPKWGIEWLCEAPDWNF